MTSRRVLKSAEAIREVVSLAILMELKDPRIRDVTVTYVEVSPDLRQAKVHVSVMGDEAKQKLSLRGLTSAAGYLQTRIAQRIDTRYTPRLQFVLDHGVKRSIEVSRILAQLFPSGVPASAPGETAGAAEQEPGASPASDGGAVGDRIGELGTLGAEASPGDVPEPRAKAAEEGSAGEAGRSNEAAEGGPSGPEGRLQAPEGS